MLKAIICALLALAAVPAWTAERSVWRIGSFNQSSGEFRGWDIDFADSKSDLVFTIGQSKDSEWYRFHPGPANGTAGGRLHPYTIGFNLAEAPRGLYRLKISGMYVSPRLSHLKVEVNGRAGLFYFHPKLDYAGGDWEGTFVPQTSADTKLIEFPAEWLKQGENRIVLTALDDPDKSENVLGAIAPGHTGLAYDGLELLNDPAARYDRKRVSVAAEPTIFYRQGTNGLNQVVDVFVSFAEMPASGRVEIQAGRGTAGADFTGTEAFGERRFAFELPEWTGTVPAQVTAGGRRFTMKLAAGKKWTLRIVPHAHLDIGFTDYPARVAELHAQTVDEATKVMERVPEFRWTLDGYWPAEQYLASRSPEKQQQFLADIRAGKFVVPLQYANQHTGTATLEGLARSFYDAHAFSKENQIPLGAAHIVDVPSYTWSYASILHDAGVKRFLAASNNWRAPILLIGRYNEKSPFWWEGPDGGRVLMWYSRAYLQLHTLFGGPPTVAAARDSMPVFLQAYSKPSYKASSTILFGSQLENTKFSREQAEFPREWHKQYAWPKVEFSSVDEALAAIEKDFGGEFPVLRGDLGPYWEDGFGSDALGTAIHRGNQQRIETAEKLAAIPTLLDPAVRPDGNLRDAWKNTLLFDEHTWTYVGATTQPEHEQTSTQTSLKRGRAVEAQRQITESIHRSWGQMAVFITSRDNSIAVFNPLNWARGGLVSFDLSDGQEIVDSVTGQVVPVEVQWIGRGKQLPGFGPGYRRVRFMAENVPPVGYKLYTLRATKQPPASPAQPTSETILDGRYYRVTLDPETAAIKSIFDKELGRELVDEKSPYRFGQYLYVTGADDMPNNSLYRHGAALPQPKLTVHPAAKARLVEVRKTPLGAIAVLEASAPNTPAVRTEITLFDAEKKLGIEYRVRKEQVLTKEAVYFAFPFAAPPAFRYGNQTGWVDPAKDILHGGSREWNTVTTWAAVEAPDITVAVVPVDAPLVAFGDIVRGRWPEQFHPANSTIFSWPMNNYWGTNFVSWQGGDFTFRYALFSEKSFDPVSLTRKAREALAPVESTFLQASLDPSRLPNTQASLLEVDAPNLLLSTWKRAEDGRGSILRLVETAGKTGTARIGTPHLALKSAARASLLEEDQAPLEVSGAAAVISFRPFEILTIRLLTEPRAPEAPAGGGGR